MKQKTEKASSAERFVAYLKGLKERGNRGALAELRRSLTHEPGTYFQSYKYTECSEARGEDETRWGLVVRSLIGGLYASHGDQGSIGKNDSNLGAAIASLYNDKKSESIEKRFLTLLDSDEEQLPHRLRQIIALLKDYRIDWVQLYRHLSGWNSDDKYVQQKWAQSFYRTSPINSEKPKENKGDQQ